MSRHDAEHYQFCSTGDARDWPSWGQAPGRPEGASLCPECGTRMVPMAYRTAGYAEIYYLCPKCRQRVTVLKAARKIETTNR